MLIISAQVLAILLYFEMNFKFFKKENKIWFKDFNYLIY